MAADITIPPTSVLTPTNDFIDLGVQVRYSTGVILVLEGGSGGGPGGSVRPPAGLVYPRGFV